MPRKIQNCSSGDKWFQHWFTQVCIFHQKTCTLVLEWLVLVIHWLGYLFYIFFFFVFYKKIYLLEIDL